MSTASPSTSTDGRERFGRNVAFAWGGYMVNVVAGFVVPRMISDHLGQATLGIWDFAWSFVSYFGLVQLGMGGSISRYVAHYRAKGDIPGLNRSVSTIAIFQRSVGWLALVLAVGCAWGVMPLFAEKLGEGLTTASWVVLFLGIEIALTTSLAVYGAVVVGCHRWDLTNSVSAGAYAVSAGGMITVLVIGGGLPLLAFVHCVCMVGAEIVRWRLVGMVCPELRISRGAASWITFKEQARYSIKTLIPSISGLLSNQSLSLLIAAFLGPSSLAIFSRSRSLMTTLRTLAMKFGMIIVPTASALHAKNDSKALSETLLSKSAIISTLVLPILVTIGTLGNFLIQLWMGSAYVFPLLLPILSLGAFATLVQEPAWSLLSGMNIHGRIAIAKLVAGVLSALLLLVGLWIFHWGLLGAAICFTLPQLIVDGMITPWHACRLMQVSHRTFISHVYLKPSLCVLPLGVAAWEAGKFGLEEPIMAVTCYLGGVLISAGCYLLWLIPKSVWPKLRMQFYTRILRRPHLENRS